MAYRTTNTITLKDIHITATTEKAYKVVIKNKKDFYQEHSLWVPKNQVLDTGLFTNYVGNITVTDWFWGKVKDSLLKTGIPIAYTQSSSSTAVDKVLEAPPMTTTQVPVPLWQMQEAKTLLKRLVYQVFKDPADLEATLDKILVIQNNQVFLNIAVTPAGPSQPLAEEMKSEVIQELLSEYFKAQEGLNKMDEYFNAQGKFIDEEGYVVKKEAFLA